jgi:membrane-associated phospholipid phosphatase
MRKMYVIILFFLFWSESFGQNADIRLLRALNPDGVSVGDPLMQAVSNKWGLGAIAAGVPTGLYLWGVHRGDASFKRQGLQIGAALAFNVGATLLLKESVGRMRPYVTYPDINEKAFESDASFPSGHSSMAFQTATSLVLNHPRWQVAVPAYLWAGTVAYSRLHLGVHYPSDVLSGALLGAGSAWLCWKINKKWQRIPAK